MGDKYHDQKWADWEEDDPPWHQVKLHRRGATGVWARFLSHCASSPGTWFRSHPLPRKSTVLQMSSDIKRWKVNGIFRILPKGATDLLTKEDGVWETQWGHAPDGNDLENWYVWCRWVPNEKVARTKSKAQTTRKPKKAIKKTGGRK